MFIEAGAPGAGGCFTKCFSYLCAPQLELMQTHVPSWSWFFVDLELCTAGCLAFVPSKANLEGQQYPADVLCRGGDQTWSKSSCGESEGVVEVFSAKLKASS